MESKSMRIQIVLVLISAALFQVAAGWSPSQGPYGGTINKLYNDGGIIYCLSKDMMYKSTDNGISWNRNGLATLKSNGFRTIVRIGTRLFLGADGVQISDDNGATWSASNSGITNRGANVTTILSFGSKIFLIDGINVYSSSDNGQNWAISSNGISTGSTTLSLGKTSKYLFVGTTPNGLYRSADTGKTWQLSIAAVGTNNAVYSMISIGDSTILAGTRWAGIYKSNNNGTTWTPVGPSSTMSEISEFAAVGNSIYAATQLDGILQSNDNGSTWTFITSGFPSDARYKAPELTTIAATANALLVGSVDYGIWRLPANGTTVTMSDSGLFISKIKRMSSTGSQLFANASMALNSNNTGATLFNSNNNGDSWRRSLTGLPLNLEIRSLVSNKTSTIVYIDSSMRDEIYRTIDGVNWAKISPTTWSIDTFLSSSSENYFARGLFKGLYKSTDNGTSWSLINGTLGTQSYYVSSVYEHGSTIWVSLSSMGSRYRTNDNGTTWTKCDSGLVMIGSGQSLHGCGNNVFLLTDTKLFRTTLNGSKWVKGDIGIKTGTLLSYMANADSSLYGITTLGDVYRVSNNDTIWRNISSTGLPVSRVSGNYDRNITAFTADNVYLYAAVQDEGVWRLALSGITGVRSWEPISAALSNNSRLLSAKLEGSKMNLALSVRQGDHVQINILTLSGKHIASIIDKSLPAGSHVAAFDVSSLSEGKYVISAAIGHKKEAITFSK